MRVFILRRLQHLLHGADLDETPRVHHSNARRHLRNHRHAMRNQNEREREILLQAHKQIEYLSANRDIQRRNRLVGYHNLRLQNQRARDSDPLSLST